MTSTPTRQIQIPTVQGEIVDVELTEVVLSEVDGQVFTFAVHPEPVSLSDPGRRFMVVSLLQTGVRIAKLTAHFDEAVLYGTVGMFGDHGMERLAKHALQGAARKHGGSFMRQRIEDSLASHQLLNAA